MTADIIALPARPTIRNRSTKHAMDDLRFNTYQAQPPARTRPVELWHLNGFNMSQVIVVRDDGYVVVGDFETVRDAALAVQAHNIVVRLKAGEDLDTVMGDYGL